MNEGTQVENVADQMVSGACDARRITLVTQWHLTKCGLDWKWRFPRYATVDDLNYLINALGCQSP